MIQHPGLHKWSQEQDNLFRQVSCYLQSKRTVAQITAKILHSSVKPLSHQNYVNT
jgi:hypothetical protein